MPELKYLYISPTNLCNHRCHVCARKDHMRGDRGFMSMELFKKIVEQIPDSVETIYLHKQGESTLNPELPEMIKWLKIMHPYKKLKLNTNLIIFNDKLAESFTKYVDVLTVSIHSINRKTYKKLHGADTFEKSIRHLEALKAWKEKSDSNMELWIDYVKQDGNKHEKESDVISYFKDLLGSGFTISFWWCINFMGMGNEGDLQIYDKISNDIMPYCIFPWATMTICWDGKVDYCFVDPEEKIFLGDLDVVTIEQVWDGINCNYFRKIWQDLDFENMEKHNIKCRKCSFLWSKQTQDYSLLPIKLREHFKEHWHRYSNIYEEKLNEEDKSLKDFYGKRVKI